MTTSQRGDQAIVDPVRRRGHESREGRLWLLLLLAATLNFGFFIGDIANPDLHNVYELFAALAVSLIATVLKFGDRTQIGAVHLATSLVADLQLIAAGVVGLRRDLRGGPGPQSTRQVWSRCRVAPCWPTWSRSSCW